MFAGFIEYKCQLSSLGGMRRVGKARFAFFVRVWQNDMVVVTALLTCERQLTINLEGFKIGRSHAHTCK